MQRACPSHPASRTTSHATSCRCPDPEASGRGPAQELAQVPGPDANVLLALRPRQDPGACFLLLPPGLSARPPSSWTFVTFDDLALLKRSDCLFSRMFLNLGLFVTFPIGVGLGTWAVMPPE